MKPYIPIFAIVAVLAIAIFVWIGATHRSATPSQTSTTTPITFPTVSGTGESVGTSTQAIMSVALNGGGTITTKDFVHNGVTIPDPSNAGWYYLAGEPGYCNPDGSCPHAAQESDFTATYDSTNQFFTISLTQEPLGDARRDAQTFMQNTLGISSENLCRLKYYIGTQNAVNETYSGRNLGFNGCAGATVLP